MYSHVLSCPLMLLTPTLMPDSDSLLPRWLCRVVTRRIQLIKSLPVSSELAIESWNPPSISAKHPPLFLLHCTVPPRLLLQIIQSGHGRQEFHRLRLPLAR